MCLGVASGYNPEKERVPESCPFTEGIRECKEASCYHNILGGCFKKGSGYNENGEHKDFNNFERIKLMNIDELAKFLEEVNSSSCAMICSRIPSECNYANLTHEGRVAYCFNSIKQWLESEYKGGDE